MESNKDKDTGGISPEEMARVRDEARACAVEIAKTMFKHSKSAQVSVLAAMMVAAGGARHGRVSRHVVARRAGAGMGAAVRGVATRPRQPRAFRRRRAGDVPAGGLLALLTLRFRRQNRRSPVPRRQTR